MISGVTAPVYIVDRRFESRGVSIVKQPVEPPAGMSCSDLPAAGNERIIEQHGMGRVGYDIPAADDLSAINVETENHQFAAGVGIFRIGVCQHCEMRRPFEQPSDGHLKTIILHIILVAEIKVVFVVGAIPVVIRPALQIQ